MAVERSSLPGGVGCRPRISDQGHVAEVNVGVAKQVEGGGVRVGVPSGSQNRVLEHVPAVVNGIDDRWVRSCAFRSDIAQHPSGGLAMGLVAVRAPA